MANPPGQSGITSRLLAQATCPSALLPSATQAPRRSCSSTASAKATTASYTRDLADDFFLVAYDLRGHGDSGKPWRSEDYAPASVWAQDMRAVMEATGASRPVVVAWSYGTLVLMDYIRVFGQADLAAINLAGSLGSLVPFRMPDNGPDSEKIRRLIKLRESPDLADRVRATHEMGYLLTDKPMAEEDRRIYGAIAQMLPGYARTAMIQRLPLDNQDLLDTLTLPVLLSLGNKDNPFFLEGGGSMAEKYESIRLSVFDDAGHSVFFEQPQRFNAELRHFVEQSVSAPAVTKNVSLQLRIS